MTYLPIEKHGLIGDLRTVALVGMDGNIDFACFPFFDSPSVFASLLDDEHGGHFSIRPLLDDATPRQMYLPESNVLMTRFQSDDSIVEISDFMPVHDTHHVHDIVRRVKAIRGDVKVRVECRPRFDYARRESSIEKVKDGVLFVARGRTDMALRLRSSVPLRIQGDAAVADLTLKAGDCASFVLEEAREGEESPSENGEYVSRAFKETVNFWRAWLKRSNYRGRWREMVNRSALTLKLLTSLPNGSIVAAPTFGLPENLGGARNWDYRYTWIRDSTFTLYALIRLGFTEEAEAFLRWIECRCEELEDGSALQVLYGIDGRKKIDESTLASLRGYRGSSPVRIGNDAYRHLQLDIYGELMDAVYLYDKFGTQISYDLWRNLARLLDWLCDNWEQPGEGIWETRAGREEFLYSRVLCWVAFDRGIRLTNKRGLPAPLGRWQDERDRIYRDVMTNFWSTECNRFVQRKGATAVDAASLLLPLLKFIGPRDPRWISTLDAITEDLVEDSLVYRYRRDAFDDGLRGHEGTFSACTFWYAECLARAGDLPKARLYFEKALGYANHLGLYSEELGAAGQHLGNFPQALTHLALISAAYDLDRRLSISEP